MGLGMRGNTDFGGTLVPLLLSETRGRWATGVAGRLPTGAAASAYNLVAAPDAALAGLRAR